MTAALRLFCLLSKEAASQLVAADFKVRRNIIKNAGQGSEFDWIMVGNGDVVLTVFGRGQPNVAA